jgi:hypothetical protein
MLLLPFANKSGHRTSGTHFYFLSAIPFPPLFPVSFVSSSLPFVENGKNTAIRVLEEIKIHLPLTRFFIGYWILKTGLDVYPGPFFLLQVNIPFPELNQCSYHFAEFFSFCWFGKIGIGMRLVGFLDIQWSGRSG